MEVSYLQYLIKNINGLKLYKRRTQLKTWNRSFFITCDIKYFFFGTAYLETYFLRQVCSSKIIENEITIKLNNFKISN